MSFFPTVVQASVNLLNNNDNNISIIVFSATLFDYYFEKKNTYFKMFCIIYL